jgi:hypothetical protein
MNFAQEVETLIRARYPILYLITSEETRVQDLVVRLAQQRQKRVLEWSYTELSPPAPQSNRKSRNSSTKDLSWLSTKSSTRWSLQCIFKDFHPFLTKSNFAVIRKLKDIALHLRHSYKTIVLISPVLEVPPSSKRR